MSRFIGILTVVGLMLSASSAPVTAYPIGLVLQVGVDPNPVAVGNQQFNMTVAIHNDTDQSFQFDAAIKYGGPAWGGESWAFYLSPGTEQYWVNCGGSMGYYCVDFWRGTVGANSTVVYKLQVDSGNQTGRFRFAKIRVITTLFGQEFIRKIRYIRVTDS